MLKFNIGLNWMFVIVLAKLPGAHFHCQSFDINTLTKFIQQTDFGKPFLLAVSVVCITDSLLCCD